LADLTKEEVRALGHKHGVRTADKGESFEICFITDNNYERFLNIPIPKRTDVMIMTILLMTLSLFIIGAQIVYLTTKIYFLVITLAIFALTIWKLLLNERDKNWLKNKFKNLRGP